MDRLDAMSAFVTVAELRGFAPAARRLGLSPSAVTRLVAALEERLSIRLLQRTTRAVRLTDGGARYLESARRILSAVDEAEGAARAELREPGGRLVVAAPSVFGRLHVAPLIGEFLTKYPAVTGQLTLSDRLVSLVDEGVDLAVRIGQLDDSSLRARPLGKTRRVVVGSPRYLAKQKRPRAPRDLDGHRLIHFSALGAAAEWRFGREGAEERVSIRPAFLTDSADAAIWHAERDGGLTMVLAYQAVDAVRAGRLEVVLAKHEAPALPIQIVYPGSRLVSASVRAFLEMAVATRDWSFIDL